MATTDLTSKPSTASRSQFNIDWDALYASINERKNDVNAISLNINGKETSTIQHDSDAEDYKLNALQASLDTHQVDTSASAIALIYNSGTTYNFPTKAVEDGKTYVCIGTSVLNVLPSSDDTKWTLITFDTIISGDNYTIIPTDTGNLYTDGDDLKIANNALSTKTYYAITDEDLTKGNYVGIKSNGNIAKTDDVIEGIGFVEADVLTTAVAQISLKNTIITNQSGLSVGEAYYFNPLSWSIGTTVTDYKIGVALTATTLLLNNKIHKYGGL